MHRGGRVATFALALLAGVGCGYRSLHDATSVEPLTVTGVQAPFADASVEAELRAGARAELARAGLLRPGGDHPRLVLEAVRLEDEPAALARLGSDPGARALRVRLVARAWVEAEPGAIERDTGSVALETTVAVEGRAVAQSWRETHAVKATARRLGALLVQRVLGIPEPADIGM